MKKEYRYLRFVTISSLLLLFSPSAMAQNTSEQPGTITINLPETLWYEYFGIWETHLAGILHTDSAGLQSFFQYCAPELNKDKGSFFTGFSTMIIFLDSTSQFFDSLDNKYIELYKQYVRSELDGSAPDNSADNQKSFLPGGTSRSTCNPACSNIGFQNGTLSYWSAFWAVDASTVATIKTADVTGGPCASVTQAAQDPNTNTYQASLMPPTGTDPLAGPLIPYTPPLGGTCALVGDGPIAGAGVGMLEQSFTVSASNPLLTLQYAVMLENPNHPGYEQPWFQIQVLDENGNEIPGCGQYFVVSGPGVPGFIPLNNAAGGDTVYCEPWTTAFVPLNNYIGQCVTVIFTASDCALGGHYGYAYVAASCSQIGLSSSSTVFCHGQRSATITGPPGGALYQWTTTDGCISGSNTQQLLQVTCAGTYTLVTSSSAGTECVDTFSITIPPSASGPPPVPCFTVGDTICSGDSFHVDASCSISNTGTKYYWDFYDNGQYEDSSGPDPQWIYTTGGNYNIRLHEVAANGCSADTVIRTVVESTANFGTPDITFTSTNASSCGRCDGEITMTVILSSLTVGITITTSFDNSVMKFSQNSTSISGGCEHILGGLGGSTFKVSPCGDTCPGTYYYYIRPTVTVPPTKCAPGGFIGDTVPVTIGVIGVNLAVSQTTVPATCGKNNGSASISVSGGTAPYTYSWAAGLGNNSSVTGLKAGSYMVTATDSAGCNKSFDVIIDSLDNLSVMAVPYYINCFGANNGAIKIQSLGGNSEYTYNWLPDVSNTDSAGGLAPGNYSVTVTDTAGCSGMAAAQIIQPTEITDSITGNYADLPCYNTGYATANPTGGYPPYTFNWSNGIHLATDTGLTSGVYILTITDANQCSITDRISVEESGGTDTVSISIIPADTVLLCNGTSITFTAIATNGGTTPFYQWQVNGNNTGSNSSSFSSDSLRNGAIVSCILTSSLACITGSPATSNAVKIKTFPVFGGQIISTGSNSICQGSSVVLTVPEDSVPVQWQSSTAGSGFSDIPGATDSSYTTTPVQTTYFRIYIPNAFCPDTSDIFQLIVKQAPLPPHLAATDSIFCAGDSVQVCIPDTFASYRWNTGDTTSCATVKQAGDYWVSVALHDGCAVVSPHQGIEVYPAASISIIEEGDTLSSFGAIGYQWFLNGNIINGATASFYVARQSGSYSVEITDSNGCRSVSSPVVIAITGVNDLLPDMYFEVYPNPASSEIQIRVGREWIGNEYELYDVCGKVVTGGNTTNEKTNIDISAMARGVYFVKMNGYVRKFMKL